MSAPIPVLERALAATTRRNASRPAIEWSALDTPRISREVRPALEFLVVNLAYIERASAPNIASLARRAPIAEVRACFAGQLEDEIAHGAMLTEWLARTDLDARRPALLARLGLNGARLPQMHGWLGIRHVELLTEHYASALLDELAPKVEEPVLRFILDEIRKDEARHKVIAVQSIRAMEEAGADRSFVARAFGPLLEKSVVSFFRGVFGSYLRGPCAALAIDGDRVLERALDEMSDARNDARDKLGSDDGRGRDARA